MIMNVKKNFSIATSKDRALKEKSLAKNKLNKGKTGEEIRKKLKVNTTSTGMIKLTHGGKENTNLNQNYSNHKEIRNISRKQSVKSLSKGMDLRKSQLKKKENLKEEQKIVIERVPLMKKSLDCISVSSCQSSKSVRFSDTFEESKSMRKSSILKNSTMMNKSNLSDRNSMKNSICSNIQKDDQSTENLQINKNIKNKYESLLASHKKIEQRYSDDVYTPFWSSIARKNTPELKNIRWKRISDLFPGKYLTLWDSNTKAVTIPGKLSKSNVIPNCFNSIKYNNQLLEKMFESQKYNSNGIYFVKINQNNHWKYIIVDDYMPVCVGADGKTDQHAFLGVKMDNGVTTQLQVWPFILQKAYAKYYSTYECLDRGNQFDFMSELTGCPIEHMKIGEQNLEKIKANLQNFDSILFAKHNNQRLYPLVPRTGSLMYQNPFNCYESVKISEEEFTNDFESVYCILLHKYLYTGICSIKYNKNNESDQHISVRSLKIEEQTECTFTLAQKDLKHYPANSYGYVWVRMLILLKQSEKNHQWISGQYRNTKNINISLSLQAGEYIVILMPEWNEKRGLDLDIIFHANTRSMFERIPYAGNEFVLTEAAMDLAQRYGTLKQLNQNICTYSYIEREIGFIIENINNERPSGQVRILRSIEGLQRPGKKIIEAFNKQFKKEKTIQVKIDSLSHFTVLLGVLGGVNKGFLDQFDFGC